jgi:thioredoxin 1
LVIPEGELYLENDELNKIKQKKIQERMKKTANEDKKPAPAGNTPMHLNDKEFTGVVGGAKIALIDFYADWCGPCRMMAPIIDTFAKEYSGKVLVAKVNVDNNPEISQKFGITSIPTFGIFKSGKLMSTIIGAVGKEALKSALERVIKQS